MPACIIPVAPNFQDPTPTPHAPPYLTDYMPQDNSDYFINDPNTGASFSAQVSDQDLGAKLQVRWAINFPPKTGAPPTQVLSDSPISTALEGQPITHQPVQQTVKCNLLASSTPPADGRYELALIVADSPLSNDPTLPADQLVDQNAGFVIGGHWTLIFNCLAPSSSTSASP